MSELLVALRKKTTFECEELHRGYITAMNGLAALSILEEKVRSLPDTCDIFDSASHNPYYSSIFKYTFWCLQYDEAADSYREALQSIAENEATGLFRTDPLQTLHAVLGLHELLTLHPDRVTGRALNDDTLPARVLFVV